MEPIDKSLREEFYPALFGGEEVDDDPRYLLGHCVKRGGIGIKYSRKSADRGHTTSVEV